MNDERMKPLCAITVLELLHSRLIQKSLLQNVDSEISLFAINTCIETLQKAGFIKYTDTELVTTPIENVTDTSN